jgi:hypothetical protein
MELPRKERKWPSNLRKEKNRKLRRLASYRSSNLFQIDRPRLAVEKGSRRQEGIVSDAATKDIAAVPLATLQRKHRRSLLQSVRLILFPCILVRKSSERSCKSPD